DACPNACEMWKAIERLKQGESINVQDLETNLFWEFGKFTSHDGESLESYYSRIIRNAGYESQRSGNVAGARETVGSSMVSPDVVDSRPIFDTEPEQKVQNDDHYDVFAIEFQHPEQSESVHQTYLIEQDAHNVIIESVEMNYDSEQIDQNDKDANLAKERELLASLIEKLKCEIDE
nr:hypothetical protein [Tanacetum cinerariifolium]